MPGPEWQGATRHGGGVALALSLRAAATWAHACTLTRRLQPPGQWQPPTRRSDSESAAARASEPAKEPLRASGKFVRVQLGGTVTRRLLSAGLGERATVISRAAPRRDWQFLSPLKGKRNLNVRRFLKVTITGSVVMLRIARTDEEVQVEEHSQATTLQPESSA